MYCTGSQEIEVGSLRVSIMHEFVCKLLCAGLIVDVISNQGLVAIMDCGVLQFAYLFLFSLFTCGRKIVKQSIRNCSTKQNCTIFFKEEVCVMQL